ncbi:MAG: Zn-ribbon domain-containing OB-fold protein [Pseudomonadales bacterium]
MPNRVPLEDGYLVFSEDGIRLLGSYSPAADVTFFPTRKRCPMTEEPVHTVELSREGTLYAWSFIHMPRMGSMDIDPGGGYAVGQIDLPEGVRVQTRIDGGPEDFEVGMPMRLEADVVATDEDGTEYCGFKFVPQSTSSTRSTP